MMLRISSRSRTERWPGVKRGGGASRSFRSLAVFGGLTINFQTAQGLVVKMQIKDKWGISVLQYKHNTQTTQLIPIFYFLFKHIHIYTIKMCTILQTDSCNTQINTHTYFLVKYVQNRFNTISGR